ncbi:MAG: hypothetical protein AAFV62_14650 [Pseudomonadota bacterium]
MVARIGQVVLHILGLVFMGAIAIGGWLAYPEVPRWFRMVRQQFPSEREYNWIMTWLNDYRLILEVLAVFLVLSIAHWLWRQTFGRLQN